MAVHNADAKLDAAQLLPDPLGRLAKHCRKLAGRPRLRLAGPVASRLARWTLFFRFHFWRQVLGASAGFTASSNFVSL